MGSCKGHPGFVASRSPMKNFPLVWKTSSSQLRIPGRAGTFFSKRANSHLQQVLLLLWPFITCWCQGGCDAAAGDWLDPGTGTAASPAKQDGDRSVLPQPGREPHGGTPAAAWPPGKPGTMAQP